LASAVEAEIADRAGVSDLQKEIAFSIGLLTIEERDRYDELVAQARARDLAKHTNRRPSGSL
jgi:hypothetical protein